MSILEIKDLTYRYKGNKHKQILNQINVSFEEGVFYVIAGVSGSGKTTLLSLLAGLDQQEEGTILFQGEDILAKGLSKHRKDHVSIVFQNYNLIDYMTPYENMRLVNRKIDSSMLLDMGLEEDEIKRTVLQLSGGQQQRAALARALANDAPIILADEPTGNLDDETAQDIIQILKNCAKELNKCVIVVTHSKQVAKEADVVLRLKKGKLYEI